MVSSATLQFIIDSCDKYEEQEVKKIQNQSSFQLVFTDTKVYDLDQIILLKSRGDGSTASSIHVVEREDRNYADRVLVFLAIDHLLFNTDDTKKYTYEGTDYLREVRPVKGINNIITHQPYDSVKDIPNYINKLKSILDPDINTDILQYLYEKIPVDLKDSDGYVEISTSGDKTYLDIV